MKVMWVTMSELADPVAEYTTADGSVTKTVSAVTSTYRVPQNWWPIFTGIIYETDMTDLIPSAQYSYRVGGRDADGAMRWSSTFSFTAQPEDNPNRRTTVGTLADHGTFMLLGFAVIDKMVAVQDAMGLEMIMVVGDLTYAGLSSAMPRLNISKEDEFEHIWDLWGIQNQPVAATRPFMVGPGNHERFYNWTAFTSRYKMPYEMSGGDGNFWYAYTYGNSRWVSISSEHSLDEGSPQMVWLQSTLAAAAEQRDLVPWIILTIHKPIYSSEDGSPLFRAQLEPLLLKYDVDLTVTGHMHSYERVHPSEELVPTVYPVKGAVGSEAEGADVYYSSGKGPVHVVQGNTGGMQFEQWIQPQPAWSAVRFANGYIPANRSSESEVSAMSGITVEGPVLESTYTDTFGFGAVTFVNATHMYYQAVPITGTIGTDLFWVVKRV